MIPTKASLPCKLEALHTVCFTFGEAREHFHERKFPVLDGRLDIIIETTDRIQDVDLSYCRCLNVWIDVPDPADYRRARTLWTELLKPENRPAMIYTDTDKGLCRFDPYEAKKEFFHA